jgi:hypothetical protein
MLNWIDEKKHKKGINLCNKNSKNRQETKFKLGKF